MAAARPILNFFIVVCFYSKYLREGGTRHRPLSFSVESLDIDIAEIILLVIIPNALAHFAFAAVRKLIGSQRAHEFGLLSLYIAEVMLALGSNSFFGSGTSAASMKPL